jgi:NitT/TauT family transport system ATP-binding protein
MSTAESAIRLTAVSKSFPADNGQTQLRVVSDLDLEVRTGEFLALVGPSGCGKTTVLKMMAGLEPYDSGTISVGGQVVRSVPANIGFVFQEPGLLPWRSVRRNVEIGLANRGDSVATRNAIVDHHLQMTGLGDFSKYLPYQLSGGMQQRVALARALVGEPQVLLMDEPFGSCDAITRSRLQDELVSIVESSRTTTVLVTHDVDEGLYCADRMAVFGVRPAGIQLIFDVPLSRPRSRTDFVEAHELSDVRHQVLDVLNAPAPDAAMS